jgi:hypothetical protein
MTRLPELQLEASSERKQGQGNHCRGKPVAGVFNELNGNFATLKQAAESFLVGFGVSALLRRSRN